MRRRRVPWTNRHEENVMNVIIWLVVGIVVGRVASMVMNARARELVLLNVAVGVVGALFGGWLLSPLVDTGPVGQGDLSLSSLLVSFAGAGVLLILVNLVRQATER
jgi:uncharacterized membrane protein YeaQ/YmgE (transglycosylase-associated protein family)